MSNIRGIKTKQVTLLSHVTTTTLELTTSILGSTTDITSYMTGVFVTNVISNASSTPAVYLDVSVDSGLVWTQYATLHPDLTTTANNYLLNVANMPNTVRVRIPSLTTTSSMRLTVKAEVFAK